MINRHGVLSWLALSLFAAPRASAQTGARLARIGWLRSDAGKPLDDELRGALRTGWVEGRNLRIETRIADNPQRGREQAAELQALPVALIVAVSTPLIRAARDGAPATPIVMVNAGDALGSGFVASLARPGGNVTGVLIAPDGTLAKQLELLKQAVPGVARFAYLGPPADVSTRRFGAGPIAGGDVGAHRGDPGCELDAAWPRQRRRVAGGGRHDVPPPADAHRRAVHATSGTACQRVTSGASRWSTAA